MDRRRGSRPSTVHIADRTVTVESRDTSSLAAADRRLALRDEQYPLTIKDADGLRKKISAAQAVVGRSKGAKGGGNQTKRLRIFIEGASLSALETLLT